MVIAQKQVITNAVIMLTARQIRAARSLLGWTQADLARSSDVSIAALNNFERGVTDARGSTLAAIERALTDAGIVFLDDGELKEGGQGVRLRR